MNRSFPRAAAGLTALILLGIALSGSARSESPPAADPAPTAAPGAASQPATVPGAASQPSTPAPVMRPATTYEGTPDSLLLFEVEIGNRMFPDWKETQEVRIGRPFYLGDSEQHAMPVRFLPDFKIGPDGPVSETRQWLNPALRILVFQDTAAVDSAWAFLNFPPHYSAKSFFSFKVLTIRPAGTDPKER